MDRRVGDGSGDLRAPRRHLHARGHLRCGRASPDLPARPRHHRGRADAAGRFPWPLRLGIRRRGAVGAEPPVRPSGRSAALRRHGASPRDRRDPRRRLQPPRPRRLLPRRLRPRVLHRSPRQRLGQGARLRRPRQRAGARVLRRERGALDPRVPSRRVCGSTPPQHDLRRLAAARVAGDRRARAIGGSAALGLPGGRERGPGHAAGRDARRRRLRPRRASGTTTFITRPWSR